MTYMLKKNNTLLVLTMFALFFVVVAMGCTDPVTVNESLDSKHANLGDDLVPEQLWVIEPRLESKPELTIEDVQRIIEKNADYYTVKGEVDVELLKKFVIEKFGSLVVITAPDDIKSELLWIRACCKYIPRTGEVRITIIIRKK